MPDRLGFVLGTRPEIIKLAPVIIAALGRGVDVRIIHTNQHYTAALDAQFFAELELPAPAESLDVGSASHGVQTGRMLERLEAAISRCDVDHVIVEGDTNSGLAGALAAVKMHLPAAHVEAGLRSFDRRMPEEINRRLIDHVADHLFPPTPAAEQQLNAERVPGKVHPATGNTIVDAVMRYAAHSGVPIGDREGHIVMTLHREENVDDEPTLRGILAGVQTVAVEHGLPVTFPAHPRTVKRITEFGIALPRELSVLEPTSFRAMLGLQATARQVMTDAGGVQEEACVLGTPCVTLRTTTERPETVEVGANVVAGVDPEGIAAAARAMLARTDLDWPQPLGDGHAGERIVEALGLSTASRAATEAARTRGRASSRAG
jgi:UDP-N-acetylglucosamine 2-epimerase (non-hydrolysing)